MATRRVSGLRSILYSRRVHYARRALNVLLSRITSSYPDQWRTDRAELMPGWEQHEHLFSSAPENFRRTVEPYVSEFRWPLGRVYNGAFQTVDAELYHATIRSLQPDLIVEIGCGHSSRFAIEALSRNGKGRLICIDPDPFYDIPKGATHLRSKVEDAEIAIFEQLREGDILFIDSSHTSSEARYHVEKVLPALQSGVTIHHHDILYPYGIPWDDKEGMAEQEIVMDFYNSRPEEYETLISTSYLVHSHHDLVLELISSYRWAPLVIPSSLWTKKR